MVGDNNELKTNLANEYVAKINQINQSADEAFKEQTQTKDQAEIESMVEKQERLEEFLNNNLISEQQYQEKLKEIIGEYSPGTLDPSILEDQNQTELDLLNEKLANQLISYESYFKNLKKLQDKDSKDKGKKTKIEDGWSNSSLKNQIDDGNTLLNALGNNSKTAHKIKQALSSSSAFMNTAEGVTKALADQNYVGAAVTATTGALQIAAILSSTPSGASSGGGGAPSQPARQPVQQNLEPETTSLELSSATQGGGTNINMTIPDGDDIGMAIASWIMKAQKEGRV